MRSPAREYDSESNVMPNVAVPGSPTSDGRRTSERLRWNGSVPPTAFSTKSRTGGDHVASRVSTACSGSGYTIVVGTERSGSIRSPSFPAKTYIPSERESGRPIDHEEM